MTGPLSNTDNFFIVADRYLRNIYQVGATSGTTAQLLPFGAASNPTAVAYDSTNKLIFWTDVAVSTINRYSLVTNSNTVIYRDPLNVGKDIGLTFVVHFIIACAYSNYTVSHMFRGRIKVTATIALHLTLNISETVRDRGLVTKDHQ